jgi:riboflavin kinase
MLPYFTQGEIVKGFGRGSRELGFPTANFSTDVSDSAPTSLECGVYFGWAKVDNGPVYQMVLSFGFNPFYNNTKKTMETHILHSFEGDLYGQMLRICIVGCIRPEKSFASLDDLVAAINEDIRIARVELNKPELKQLSTHDYFLDK